MLIYFIYQAAHLTQLPALNRIQTAGALHVYKLPYPKSPAELRLLRDELYRMLKLKIVAPSKSEWGAPCILIRKPEEIGVAQNPRFVVDYLGLNSVTKGDGYPILSIANISDP